MAHQNPKRGSGHADFANIEATETVHHEAQVKKRAPERGVKQLNLTSMLDVTFQLLIFFVLTANFAMDEGVLAADLPQGVPETPTESEPPDPPVIVRLQPVGVDDVRITVDGVNASITDFRELYAALNEARYDPQSNPNGIYEDDNPIVIKPMSDVRWEHVVNAFNSVIRAKYTNISFAQS